MKRFVFAVRAILFFFAFQQIGWAWEVQPNGAGVKVSWGGDSKQSSQLEIAKRQIEIIEAESYDRSKEFSTSMAYRPERPLISKEQFLIDLEAGRLLATLGQFQEALAHAGISVTNVPEYLRGLEWRKNEVQVPARMARLLHSYSAKRSRVDYGLVRNLEAGESALWDGNRPIIAGDCGNVIVGIVGQRQEQKTVAELRPPVQPPPAVAIVEEKPASVPAPAAVPKEESWLAKNWPWVLVGVAAIVGGIAIAAGGHGGGSSSPSLGPSPPPPGNK